MKALVYRFKSNPKYARAFYWGRNISITGSTQVIVQAISLFCGLLIIRFLSPHEYALYTLANMMLSTMTVLAECDISSAVMAQGGKVWRDPTKLGIVLVTAFDIRRKFGTVSMILITPVLLYPSFTSWSILGFISVNNPIDYSCILCYFIGHIIRSAT
jgi:hypothetical protein